MSEEYCPICQRVIVASSIKEFESGEHEGYVFIHDIHTSSKEAWAKVKSEFPETMEMKERSGMGIVRKI